MPPARLDRVFCRARETARPATLSRAMMEVSSTPMEPSSTRASSSHSTMDRAERRYRWTGARAELRDKMRSTARWMSLMATTPDDQDEDRAQNVFQGQGLKAEAAGDLGQDLV